MIAKILPYVLLAVLSGFSVYYYIEQRNKIQIQNQMLISKNDTLKIINTEKNKWYHKWVEVKKIDSTDKILENEKVAFLIKENLKIKKDLVKGKGILIPSPLDIKEVTSISFQDDNLFRQLNINVKGLILSINDPSPIFEIQTTYNEIPINIWITENKLKLYSAFLEIVEPYNQFLELKALNVYFNSDIPKMDLAKTPLTISIIPIVNLLVQKDLSLFFGLMTEINHKYIVGISKDLRTSNYLFTGGIKFDLF